MVNINDMESLANRYVDCWEKTRHDNESIWEDNDFGCEGLQIFRNGFEIEKFRYQELCKLSVLLTRTLRGQTNNDHKIFWCWCAFIAYYFKVGDMSFVGAFNSLVNLLLADNRKMPGIKYLEIREQSLKYVNCHMLNIEIDKYLISPPLVFSVMEGLLRRKNKNYVNIDGMVHTPFIISTIKNNENFRLNRRMNRISDELRLFEQITVNKRNRQCKEFDNLKNEISKLYSGDLYDLIYSWRNDLVHGKEYWINKVPLLMNIICILIIDEIDPNTYDNKKGDILKILEFEKTVNIRSPLVIFPPDLNLDFK